MADLRPWPWQHVSEPATPAETDGERIARKWLRGSKIVGPHPDMSDLADLARRIDEDRATLACATHRACKRTPGDCCMIGSVIGYWDQHWTEVVQERDRLAGERDALRAALLATRDHDEPDGPCWCPAGLSSEAGCRHTPRCRRARAALAGCDSSAATTQNGAATTPDVLPSSIRGLDPNFTTEPAP